MAMRMNELFYERDNPSWMQRRRSYDPPAEFPRGSCRYLPTIEFRVPMCCSKCEEKVIEELSELAGVYKVFCDQLSGRVAVTGHVDPFQALKKMKRINKKSEFWDWGASTKFSYDGSLHRHQISKHDTVYRSSPNQASYYMEPSRTYAYKPSYRNSSDAYEYRPSSPAFSLPRSQSYRYERVPPYEQTYYTEDYPSYTYY